MEKRIQVGDRLKASKVTSDYGGCTLKISSPGKDFQVEMVFDRADKTRGSTLKFWSLECSVVRVLDSWDVHVLNVPVEITPDIPAEPMNRGAVVTIEGDDEFIALRFTGADDFPDPFLAVYTAEGHEDSCSWKELVSRAEGRKIIVRKMVDPNEAPNIVNTYSEWCTLPKDELSKYQWEDKEEDLWIINAKSGEFEVDGVADGPYALREEYFPLTRDEKIG